MAKRHRSLGFGWLVRQRRVDLDMSQAEVVAAVKGGRLTQPDLSVIERHGAIPPTKVLEKLCVVLNIPIEEAWANITGSQGLHLAVKFLANGRDCFLGYVRERMRVAGSVMLYVVRDSYQPPDQVRTKLYRQLLETFPTLTVRILFLSDDRQLASSFRMFWGSLAETGIPEETARRVEGYLLRRPSVVAAMPMASPLALLVDRSQMQMITWHFCPDVMQAAGTMDETEAVIASLFLDLNHDKSRAAEMVNWIGFRNERELNEDWTKIEIH